MLRYETHLHDAVGEKSNTVKFGGGESPES